jgi:hypothetical protein
MSVGSLLVRVCASLLFLAFLWSLIRFAVGLRFEKRAREKALDLEELEGRRLVAEIPLDARMLLVLDDGDALIWDKERLEYAEIAGARMLLNGRALASVARPGFDPPQGDAGEDVVERERWEVRLYRRDGTTRDLGCGSLREGVSREIATRVFDAVRAAFKATSTGPGAGRGAGSPP